MKSMLKFWSKFTMLQFFTVLIYTMSIKIKKFNLSKLSIIYPALARISESLADILYLRLSTLSLSMSEELSYLFYGSTHNCTGHQTLQDKDLLTTSMSQKTNSKNRNFVVYFTFITIMLNLV